MQLYKKEGFPSSGADEIARGLDKTDLSGGLSKERGRKKRLEAKRESSEDVIARLEAKRKQVEKKTEEPKTVELPPMTEEEAAEIDRQRLDMWDDFIDKEDLYTTDGERRRKRAERLNRALPEVTEAEADAADVARLQALDDFIFDNDLFFTEGEKARAELKRAEESGAMVSTEEEAAAIDAQRLAMWDDYIDENDLYITDGERQRVRAQRLQERTPVVTEAEADAADVARLQALDDFIFDNDMFATEGARDRAVTKRTFDPSVGVEHSARTAKGEENRNRVIAERAKKAENKATEERKASAKAKAEATLAKWKKEFAVKRAKRKVIESADQGMAQTAASSKKEILARAGNPNRDPSAKTPTPKEARLAKERAQRDAESEAIAAAAETQQIQAENAAFDEEQQAKQDKLAASYKSPGRLRRGGVKAVETLLTKPMDAVTNRVNRGGLPLEAQYEIEQETGNPAVPESGLAKGARSVQRGLDTAITGPNPNKTRGVSKKIDTISDEQVRAENAAFDAKEQAKQDKLAAKFDPDKPKKKGLFARLFGRKNR